MPSSGAFSAAVESAAPARVVPPSALLTASGIVLLELGAPPSGGRRGRAAAPEQAPGQRGRGAPSSAKFTAAASDLGTPVPVFELGGADVVLTNEVIVRPKDLSNVAVRRRLDQLGETSVLPHGTYRLRVKGDRSALDVSNELARSQAVAYSEPNFITIIQPGPRMRPGSPVMAMGGSAGTFPSDQLFPQQWSLANSGSVGKKGADINVEKAWKTADGGGVTIAILDDGVDETHADLKAKIVKSFDATTNTKGQKPGSADTHGTACAGIAAASTNNVAGIAGVGYKAQIMPVKIASTDPVGHYWITTPEIIARGIDYAVDNGADVISNSWGGGDSSFVEDAIVNGIANGRNKLGAVFVFAAGNDGGDVMWPASLAGSKPIIAVAAINEWDERKTTTSKDGEDWWASNRGAALTVSAPGVHILTTDLSGVAGHVPGDYVTNFNGTSSATPHVAGVAALILSKEKSLTAAEVKQRIEKTAEHLGIHDDFGAGRINACKAVLASGC